MVEQPLALLTALERPKSQAVGLEMIGLRLVHRHQVRWRTDPGDEPPRQQAARCGGDAEPDQIAAPHQRPAPDGTAPRSASRNRRAAGTTALSG